jgi:hypothetical protein
MIEGSGRTNIMWIRWIRIRTLELTRGPPVVSSALSFIGGFHIGTRALHVLNLIWFGNIARLSHLGGGGNFLVQMITIFTCRRYV